MSMAVADWSGQAWLQGFNETGVAVFEKTADEVMEIKVGSMQFCARSLTHSCQERDETEYNALMAQSAGKTFNFSCRAKQDTYNVSRHTFVFETIFIFCVGANACEIRNIEDKSG